MRTEGTFCRKKPTEAEEFCSDAEYVYSWEAGDWVPEGGADNRELERLLEV